MYTMLMLSKLFNLYFESKWISVPDLSGLVTAINIPLSRYKTSFTIYNESLFITVVNALISAFFEGWLFFASEATYILASISIANTISAATIIKTAFSVLFIQFACQ